MGNIELKCGIIVLGILLVCGLALSLSFLCLQVQTYDYRQETELRKRLKLTLYEGDKMDYAVPGVRYQYVNGRFKLVNHQKN